MSSYGVPNSYTLGLQMVSPGNFTLSPVPKLRTRKFFLAKKLCASIDRFMLDEQITAIESSLTKLMVRVGCGTNVPEIKEMVNTGFM